MKKLSQGRFDKIEMRPDDKAKKAKAAEKYFQKNKNTNDMKISRFHANFIKLEGMATKGNILALIVGICAFIVFVLPYLMYCWSVVDRHYLGWFYDPVALFAKTTDEKMYYLSESIPFVTIDDIQQEHHHYAKRLKEGYPSHYEVFKGELYESVLAAIGYKQPHARSLQETQEEDTSTILKPVTNATADDDEEVLLDSGPKYEALYPAPFMSLK